MCKNNIFILIILIFLINIGFSQELFLLTQPDTLLNHNDDNTIIWASSLTGAFGGFLKGNKIALKKSSDDVYFPINSETVKWTMIGAGTGAIIGWMIKRIIIGDNNEKIYKISLYPYYYINKRNFSIKFNLNL